MGKFGALLFNVFFTVFILALSFSCKAIDEDRKAYIVYMGALPDGVYTPSTHHFSILQSIIQDSSIAGSFIRSYKRSFNGFAAKLTDQERQKLASMKEIVSIFRSEIFQTQTTRSWDFMGLHEKIDRKPTAESDTIIGVIDTGIWPELESFSDEGFGPPPKKWKGACTGGTNFTCNNKIVRARYYLSFGSGYESARDLVGHGSHTASTAAGNNIKDVSFYGIAEGTARGGVPSSRIAAYKVCDPEGCYSHSILAAFDDAIADGVDIITVSLGSSGAHAFEVDPIAIGSFHAMAKGILTLNSAGNSGPSLQTVSSLAPWLMTVAASSIDRRIISKVSLANGTTIIGSSVNSFKLNETTFPLVHGRNGSTRCSELCEEGFLDRCLVEGTIVLCDRVIGIKEAYRAGALGSISVDGTFSDVSFVSPLPAVTLNQTNYMAIISYLCSTEDPRATILQSETIKDIAAPVVVSFSSRGPNAITPDIMKPDITAPGVDILASYSPVVPPSDSFDDTRRVKYNIMSGTSMSCPHVAGAAAYVKTFHPDWSPSAIKSALMTTAFIMNDTDHPNKEFDHGSGHVNPTTAINPGLVYESSEVDYVAFLCSIGYDDVKVRRISGDNSTCPKSSEEGSSPRYLNYPSMTAQVPAGKPFMVRFPRRVTYVGDGNSTYTARILPKLKLHIKVTPSVFSFQSLGEEKSFDVIVKGKGLSDNSIVSTSLVWTDRFHNVRSPIVLHSLFST
ncbi:subtilisin-like protease SBT4.6 isoform X2 [Morus notabilis]|uniref:subtilisin-like protease SBT4.6 isoform X2 n=1 Tax=Morus notabilis TaxID=981085 RepID=UPI000CED6AAF|nr:subtilisin-like protease SBT4.6 isoform X2 [Morus notabilis]